MSWQELKFLEKEKNWKDRKIKEEYIQTNSTKKQKVMNLETGFDIDPFWNDFNLIFRSDTREIWEIKWFIFYFARH